MNQQNFDCANIYYVDLQTRNFKSRSECVNLETVYLNDCIAFIAYFPRRCNTHTFNFHINSSTQQKSNLIYTGIHHTLETRIDNLYRFPIYSSIFNTIDMIGTPSIT